MAAHHTAFVVIKGPQGYMCRKGRSLPAWTDDMDEAFKFKSVDEAQDWLWEKNLYSSHWRFLTLAGRPGRFQKVSERFWTERASNREWHEGVSDR